MKLTSDFFVWFVFRFGSKTGGWRINDRDYLWRGRWLTPCSLLTCCKLLDIRIHWLIWPPLQCLRLPVIIQHPHWGLTLVTHLTVWHRPHCVRIQLPDYRIRELSHRRCAIGFRADIWVWVICRRPCCRCRWKCRWLRPLRHHQPIRLRRHPRSSHPPPRSPHQRHLTTSISTSHRRRRRCRRPRRPRRPRGALHRPRVSSSPTNWTLTKNHRTGIESAMAQFLLVLLSSARVP